MRDSIIALLRPFCGVEVRRLTGFVLLAVAMPRLPGWPGPTVVYPLHLLPQGVFGVLTFAVGIALLLTSTKRWRLRFVSRLVAVLAFAMWITLAAATTSNTSMFIDIIFAYAMFGEITTQHGDCE